MMIFRLINKKVTIEYTPKEISDDDKFPSEEEKGAEGITQAIPYREICLFD